MNYNDFSGEFNIYHSLTGISTCENINSYLRARSLACKVCVRLIIGVLARITEASSKVGIILKSGV